jgi:hypothetical protein
VRMADTEVGRSQTVHTPVTPVKRTRKYVEMKGQSTSRAVDFHPPGPGLGALTWD